MKIKDLVSVLDRASEISAGDQARLLSRLSKILSKLPANETVSKALKKPAR